MMKKIILTLCICLILFSGCQNGGNADREPISKIEIQKIVYQTKTLASLTRAVATVLENQNVISTDDYDNVYKIATIVYAVADNTEDVVANIDEEDIDTFAQVVVDRFITLMHTLSDVNAVNEGDVRKIEDIVKELNMILAAYTIEATEI